MFCGNCGKPIAYANAKFCPACGAPVRVQPDAANEPPKVPVPPRPEEPETPAVPVVEPTPATVGQDAPIPPQDTADTAPTAEPEPLVQPTAPDEDKPSVLPFALGGAGLLAALAAAFMALRRKKPAPAAPLPVQPAASDAPATMMAEATMFGGTAAIFGGDAAPLTVTLTDLADPAHTVTFPLDGTVSLGRDPGLCRIVLDYDPSISRHQCDLCLRGGDVVLVNRSSSNGTKVNGEKITTECPLTDGSIIKMGNAQLRLTIT